VKIVDPESNRRGWITIFVLSVTQALSQSGSTMVMTVTALTGAYLADGSAVATLPLALQFLAMMAATVPASVLMRRYGRRTGLSAGQAVGAVSALVAAYGILHGQFLLFAAGSMGIGIHNAFWQQLRFAATETVVERYHARAISYVLAGGIVAAVAGPWLAVQTRDLLSPVLFAGCYVALAGLNLAAILVLQGARFDRPAAREGGGNGRSLAAVSRQPAFMVAVGSAALGNGSMFLVMTVTPLAMVNCGLEFGDAAFVIQWHVLAMFVPSFFTGNLINRIGVYPVIAAGALLNLLAMSANISGVALENFWFGLVAIGTGWNFMFIGGTTLLAEICRPEERFKVQALNDFLVFGTVAASGFLSGSLYSALGWVAVNVALGMPLLAFLAVIALSMVRHAATKAKLANGGG